MDPGRSYATVTKTDLKRLARLAEAEREDFFSRHREYALLYRKRLLCAALCGDAALHFLNGVTGIDQFEAVSFYAEHAEAPFPYHHVSHQDLGASKFGRSPDLPETYAGRRVELRGRSIDARPDDDPLAAVQRYLRAGATPTARELASKAVVLIDPDHLVGLEAWPSLALPSRHQPRATPGPSQR
jgi:hypothetical protein